MKTRKYFEAMRSRPDRQMILDEWIERALSNPVAESVQHDGRIRRWALIPEMGSRFLLVVLLSDGETVHKAFFDRSFRGGKG